MPERFMLFAMLCGAFCGPVLAHDEATDEAEVDEGPWSGEIGLGYLAVKGNTDTTTANFNFTVQYVVNKWEHRALGTAFGSSDDNDSTAENYKLDWRTKYNFTDVNYAFGQLTWNKDRFSSYDRQNFAVAGFGRRFINQPKYQLNGELGAGYQDSRTIDGVTEDGVTGRASGDFTWAISDTSKFVQTLSVSISSFNTYTESVSSLNFSIIGALGLTLSYRIRHNSDVPPGTEKTDTFTTIGLAYTF